MLQRMLDSGITQPYNSLIQLLRCKLIGGRARLQEPGAVDLWVAFPASKHGTDVMTRHIISSFSPLRADTRAAR